MDGDKKQRIQRELLLRVGALSKPPVSVAQALAAAVSDVHFVPGETIYRKGETPDGHFYITSGEVDLVSDGPDEPWTFKEGSVVGILDVLLGRPRARTAIARTPVEAMELAAEDYFEVMEDHPDYLAQIRRELPREMHDKLHCSLPPDGGFLAPEADDGRAAWLDMTPVETLVVLRNAPYFEMASVQALVVLVQGAEIRRLVAGETLFDVGQQGDRFYLVAAGVVSLVGPILQARFGRGQILGGAPAFTDRMHAYRAVAETESILIGVRHTDLDDACEDHFDLARSIWRGTALDRDRLMTLRARRQAEAARADAAE